MLPPRKNITDASIVRVSTLDYFSLLVLSYEAIVEYATHFSEIYPDYSFPDGFLNDLNTHVKIDTNFLLLVLLFAVFWTILRLFITEFFSKPIANRLNVSPLYRHKFPESVWKFFFYGSAWLWSAYVLVLSGRYQTFWDPLSIWIDWTENGAIPLDIYISYVVQGSFYLHSVPATLFIDLWRKDSYLMLVHHFLSLALISLSYGTNHVQEGILLLFLHDNTDMMLELTKLCVYLKRRNRVFYPSLHYLGNTAFILFVGFWFLFRLYWYPLKLLYAAVYAPVWLAPADAPFYPLFTAMLVFLFAMNIYWFHFILLMTIRVCRTGEEMEDNREFDTSAVSGIPRAELERLADQSIAHDRDKKE